MLFLTHRWLGVGIALLMAVWAASGIVMMYVSYPETTFAERMGGLDPLDLKACCTRIPASGPFDAAAVEMLAGAPVLQLDREGVRETLDLTSGRRVQVDTRVAGEVARAHMARSSGSSPSLQVRAVSQDQWTVSGEFRNHLPLYKATVQDARGTVLYVSGSTGEVVQDTTGSERFWNWLGAIPHWLYFKQLRANGPLWSQVVVYASLLGSFLTITGLYIGIIQFRRGRRAIPYRGMAWWHHVTGLVFGIFTLTWVASGLFSMNPWGMMESAGPGARLAAIAGRQTTADDLGLFLHSLASQPPTGAVRAELSVQGGEPYAIIAEPSGLRWRASLPGLKPAPLGRPDLERLAARVGGTHVRLAEMIAEDAYHYAARGERPVHAWRVRLDDDQRSRFYFDPQTGELSDFNDAASRSFRWWHSALHRFDFAPALRQRPLWDAVVLPLMLGVTLLCLIGLYLAGRRVWRTIRA